MKRSSVRPSVRLAVPSFDSSSGVRRVSRETCGQEISIDSGGAESVGKASDRCDTGGHLHFHPLKFSLFTICFSCIFSRPPAATAPQHGAQQQMRAVSR